MTLQELEATIESLKELKRMREELDAEISEIESTLKKFMTDEGTDEMFVGATHKITYKDVFQTRIDSSLLRQKAPKTYEKYVKVTSYKRLLVT